jgi:pyrroline-5-carboxylate reductase
MAKISFIGAGNMATAICAGMLKSGKYKSTDITMSDPDATKLAELHNKYGVATTTDNNAAVANADIVILAIKPQMAKKVLNKLTLDNSQIVVSIMAGVATDTILSAIPKADKLNLRIVRVMPNTPLLVSQGMSALCAGKYAINDDVATAQAIFDCAGKTMVVAESQLDAIGAISGCGPAYFFLILEALSDAGVKMGLPRAMALELATQTALGSATMVQQTGTHPAALKDMVTSPGGTTIAAVSVLEDYAVRSALIEAVEAAVEKTKRIG